MRGADSWRLPCEACGHHPHPGEPCACGCQEYRNLYVEQARQQHFIQALAASERAWRYHRW